MGKKYLAAGFWCFTWFSFPWTECSEVRESWVRSTVCASSLEQDLYSWGCGSEVERLL